MRTIQIDERDLNVRDASTGFYLRAVDFLNKLSSKKMTVDDLARMSIALIWECVGEDEDRKPSVVNPGLTMEWLQNHVSFQSTSEVLAAMRAAGLPISSGASEKPQGEALPQ